MENRDDPRRLQQNNPRCVRNARCNVLICWYVSPWAPLEALRGSPSWMEPWCLLLCPAARGTHRAV